MNSKAKKKPGSIVLSIISVILAAIFMTPILWSLAVPSRKRESRSIVYWTGSHHRIHSRITRILFWVRMLQNGCSTVYLSLC